jgi:hypothetical protein
MTSAVRLRTAIDNYRLRCYQMLARVTGTFIPIFHPSPHRLNLQRPCQLSGKFKKLVVNLVDSSGMFAIVI